VSALAPELLAAGALSPVSLTLDGIVADLHGVLADITIRHGRTGYYDSASPSTLDFTLLDVSQAFTRPLRLGTLVVFNASDGSTTAPRFTGRLTDATLVDNDLSATAVGRLRTLSGYTVGVGDYPAEAWSARVTRVFTEAGLASVLELQAAAYDPLLGARLANPVDLASYLDSLATAVEAAVADRPDGRILVQAIAARTLSNAYALDPAEVEYAPEWEQRLPEANRVTVAWGPDPQATVTAQDNASIALYGPIAVTFATELTTATDATTMANNRLARNAYAHWTTPAAPLLVGRRLAIGQPLTLSHLPAAAPFNPWAPILEGWTDRVISDGVELDWTMELALSDPGLSGLALPWNSLPSSYHWNTINQTTQWRDALSLDSLAP
jgi:hypothetical protein